MLAGVQVPPLRLGRRNISIGDDGGLDRPKQLYLELAGCWKRFDNLFYHTIILL